MSHSPSAHTSNPAQTFEDFYVPSIFRPWAGELLDWAKPQARERVLDVACATGIVARTIALHFNGDIRITGVDFNPSMLEVARSASAREHVDIDWVDGNAEHLPFRDASCDLVLIQQGIQFFSDRAMAAAELFRVLVPGGRLVSSTWAGIDRNPFNKVFAVEIRRHLGITEEPLAFSLGSREELIALFAEAAFDGIEVVTVRREVRYPSPDQFVELGVESASVAVADLANMDAAKRVALVDTIQTDMGGTIQQYSVGGELVAPMEAQILVACKAD